MRSILFYFVLFLVVFSTLSSVAQELPEQKEKADSLYASFAHYNYKLNYDSAMYYGDEFVNHRLKYGTISQTIVAYSHKIRSLQKFNKLNEAFKMALTIYDEYCGNNIDMNECENCYHVYNHLAEFMITLRDYRQGINYINKGCNPTENEGNFYTKAKLYSLMGMPDSAVMQTLESIRIAKDQNKPRKLVATYNQHGLINKNLEQYDEAIVAFSEAIKLVDSFGLDERRYGFLIGNLGSCYYLKGDLDRAYSSLTIDSDKSKVNDRGSYFSAEIMLAEIDIKRKSYQTALIRLNGLQISYEELNEYNPLISISQELNILEMYMDIFQILEDKENYEYYLKKWVVLIKKESQSSVETNQILVEEYAANTIRQVTIQIETEKELLRQQMIVEEQKSRMQKWLLAAGALIVILIILFFLYRFRKRALLKENQLKLATNEKELLKLKVKEESRNVQVLSHELTVKQDFSENLINQLGQLESISKPELNSIEFFIQNELDIKSTRAHLQNQMGEISSNFHNELKIKHANLSELDLRLAAMVVMKMSNKEIAVSKNTTVESSKKAKNRLKKKLKILATDELSTYLAKFV